ncbi:LysR family transcriptional regulator [Paenalcaligenes niemegkensis]|uniref:LysR family transcriptional regulator n=1 Tax=Paenalcaligenes niemegkensis TaxID=2895469 RepID=UPI001EE8C3F8|nr:LysR family transcriptional regulator [Paenalcaligenes niemegkensis]MCQ9618082.1 LysR family transcriptional regulator [Paenalcaligenes niemegkensis]
MQSLAFKYFLEVAHHGSLSAASESLDVAISAISRQISQLEQRVGMPLFERGARGMTLTAAGHLLLTHAQRQKLETEAALQDISRLKGLQQHHIRIACSQGLANEMVPKAIATFQHDCPETLFSLWVGSALAASERVAAGKSDMAITFSTRPASNVVVRYAHRSAALAIMHKQHPLAKHERLSLKEIVMYPVALTDTDTSTRKIFDMACNMSNIDIEPVLESNYAEALHAYVRSNSAVLFASYVSMADRLERNDLVVRPVTDAEMHSRSIQVQVMEGRLLPSSIERFIDLIIEDLEAKRLAEPR